ncbi:DNA polymerase [Yersinia phage vB_YenM_P778]
MFDDIDFENLNLVGDAETDGLLEQFTKVHVLAFCDYSKNDDEDIWVFTDQPILGHKYTKYIKGGLRDGVEFALRAKRCCIHNFSGYDWWVMNFIAPDIFNIDNPKCQPWNDWLQDSLTQSRVQWQDRPTPRGYKGAHGLAAWGHRVGVPKPEIDEWGTWNAAILTRVVDDIRINAKTKRALDNEYRKLRKVGADTYPTYKRCKETQFWMTQQSLNGWKADVPLMLKYVKEFDAELDILAKEIEPFLPKTLVLKGKCTFEEFALSWNEYVVTNGTDHKSITKYPQTKYKNAQYKGETVVRPIKPLALASFKIVTVEKLKCYVPIDSITGEEHGESFIKMADARARCKDLGKDWKPAKRESEKYLYNTHVAKHMGFEREYDGVIAGPFTQIELLDSTMTQTVKVKDYLYKCGWVPDEWNYKTDSDNRPVKVCRLIDNKKLLRRSPRHDEMVQQCGLRYVEHDGFEYIEFAWSIKKYTRLLEPTLLRTSPKLTESSYDTISGDTGQKIARYNTLQHRRRTMENPKHDEKGWVNLVRPDGRLSAGASVHATSTGRMTQYGIVNVPSGSAVYGPPMREVWSCEDGTNIVSVDMNSAQLVILCNYMGDESFTEAVKNGKEEYEFKKQSDGRYYCKHADTYLNPEVDKYLRYDSASDLYVVYSGTDAHTLNSVYFALNEEEDIITCRMSQDEDLLHKITGGRKKAKNGIYALLFGAGDEKFAKTIKMKDKDEGARTKQTYFVRLPKIKALLDSLEADFKASKKALEEVFGVTHPISKGGFVHVAGAHLWVKSPHKLLNYLLMGTEAQIQNEAVNLCCQRLLKEGFTKLSGRNPATGTRLLCAYHDEQSYEVPLADVVEVKKITDWMYGQASVNLGLKQETYVVGAAKVGLNWLAVH